MEKIETIFLDRDGVINRKPPEGDYVKCWEEFEFIEGAKHALKLLKKADLRLIVVTNQRGVARGLIDEAELQKIHHLMMTQLSYVGVYLDAIYYCPHDEGQCSCRKPQIGMFLQAEMDIPEVDFNTSVVIGDSLVDMEAAVRLGCQTILIADGNCKDKLLEEAAWKHLRIDWIVSSLIEATASCLWPFVRKNY